MVRECVCLLPATKTNIGQVSGRRQAWRAGEGRSGGQVKGELQEIDQVPLEKSESPLEYIEVKRRTLSNIRENKEYDKIHDSG